MQLTDMIIPADIPSSLEPEYIKNISAISKNTGRLMLFACDQKIEHLNQDFYGSDIAADAADPEHLFRIAAQGRIGAFATHLGLIARYGRKYPNINYIVKLNGKTNLVEAKKRSWLRASIHILAELAGKDPISTQLWTVDDVVQFKKNSGLSVCGVGYTIYLGSQYEELMLAQAAQIVYQAHQYGLVALLWIYPRGISIKNDQAPQLVAGATGVAASLGADFVKIKPPSNVDDLVHAVRSAGTTQVICSGGAQKSAELFLQELSDQLRRGQVNGCATGRNIFQKPLAQAIAMTYAIAAIIFDGKNAQEAMKIYEHHD